MTPRLQAAETALFHILDHFEAYGMGIEFGLELRSFEQFKALVAEWKRLRK